MQPTWVLFIHAASKSWATVSALDGLRTIADLARPGTIRALKGAGTLSAMSPVAVSTALPWLLGRGPSLGVLSQMNAVALGNKTAILDRSGRLTFRGLDRMANQVAGAISAAGVAPGEPVAMILRNGREMAAVILGCQKAGFIACPMNTWARTKELKATLDNAGPKIVFYDTKHTGSVAGAVSGDACLIAVGAGSGSVPGSIPFNEFLGSGSGRPPFPFTRRRGSAKIIIHTSGTTGTPRGAQRDAASSGLGRMAEVLSAVPYRREDVIYCPAPLFHSFGLLTFTMATALGATLVLPERFDPEDSLRLMEEHRATAASFVPVMIKRIVEQGDEVRDRYDLSHLRLVIASGSALSADLRAAAAEVFGPVLYDLYGSTEAGWVAIATPEHMAEEPRTVGRPVPGTEVLVLSKDGEELPTGEVGEIHIKSEMIFEGYTSGDNRPFVDGYISIGDLGRVDERGYLFVEGRADDMVVVGGENVYPIEIEEVIESLPGVTDAAVTGAGDPDLGQVLVAYVAGDTTEEKVIAHCKSELASYKVPRRVKVMTELPHTSTGKILKRELNLD